MRKLYEINDDIAKLIELDADRFVDGETGEIVSREAFDALQVERDEKIEGVALGYKNEDAKAKAIEAEIKNLKERMERHKKRAEGYKQFLAVVLEGAKFETAKCSIKFSKSQAVELDDGLDINSLPEEYLRYKEPEVNKAQLKTDLKAGKQIEGVTLVTRENIQIK